MGRIITSYLARVEEIVRQGQKEGLIRSDLAPGTISVMFLGMIQPAAILSDISEGEFDLVRHAEQAWQLFRDAIRERDVRTQQRKTKKKQDNKGQLT